jgi:hypothetical protein
MPAPPAGVRVLVATRPVDFRRGADGLAAVVQTALRQDAFSGTIYVFRSKRADRAKLPRWDGSGLVLVWKRLEASGFKRIAALYDIEAEIRGRGAGHRLVVRQARSKPLIGRTLTPPRHASE